ncbi:MAG: hypothetical protein BZ151_05170 [Desulfobacca sp. 4484_104]|nr:MAG: hypothetical protein BZ151_05170 [Desulfobacca sp. 4484_104]RLA89417.1 MAG: hypothetical protein DRG58_05205 [Deltaproteobacteria bacterium]
MPILDASHLRRISSNQAILIRQLLVEVLNSPLKLGPNSSNLSRSTPGPETKPWSDAIELQNTLVAGVFWEEIITMVTTPPCGWLCNRMKKALVQKLGGYISLQGFYQLMARVDLLTPEFLRAWTAMQRSDEENSTPNGYSLPASADQQPEQGALDCLGRVNPAGADQPNSAADAPAPEGSGVDVDLTFTDLQNFFKTLDNLEFRLKDFEDFFQVNKARAFLYVTALIKEGIICHNGKKTVGVRYTPAPDWAELLKADL